MPRRNRQTGTFPAEKRHVSQWPGKTANPSVLAEVFPEDIHERWYPTGWGAGCGPDLTASPVDSQRAPTTGNRPGVATTPSFEIGSVCPNCGFAKLTLDADECVSCPLCLFGGFCDCSG